jgi:hypothetical protein
MKHVHAELMALYAQDAMETDKPWERWEYKLDVSGEWISFMSCPTWNIVCKYRRKPCTIKVNGFDVPEPMREKPSAQSAYWVASSNLEPFYIRQIWNDHPAHNMWLSRGLIHSKKEAAAKHAMAMCGIDPATYKEEE